MYFMVERAEEEGVCPWVAPTSQAATPPAAPLSISLHWARAHNPAPQLGRSMVSMGLEMMPRPPLRRHR